VAGPVGYIPVGLLHRRPGLLAPLKKAGPK
jgi:hypothetical protein